MTTPLVSICCITYNHAPFIRQCLDGFLMQEGVDYEILIHDDCSTDGTTEIVREYATKYPNLIKPLYETENQFCKPDRESIDFYNYRRAQGKYIAYCEGDDYWTDPLKLKKQVDFMEAHPEYSVCFTHNDHINHFISKDVIKYPINANDKYVTDISLMNHINGELAILPLTMLFRVRAFNYDWSKHYTQYCDTMEVYHLLKVGRGAVLNFVSALYNCHSGGVSSSNTDIRRSWENVRDSWEMYHYIGDDVTKSFYKKSLQWRLDVCKRNGMRADYYKTYQFAMHNTFMFGCALLWTNIKRQIKKMV